MSGGVWIGNKSIYPLSNIDMTGIFMYDRDSEYHGKGRFMDGAQKKSSMKDRR